MKSTNNCDILRWYNEEGQLHRCGAPATIYPDGKQYWYKEGEWHREDGPAVYNNVYTGYWLDGVRVLKISVFLRAIEKSLDLNEFWK